MDVCTIFALVCVDFSLVFSLKLVLLFLFSGSCVHTKTSFPSSFASTSLVISTTFFYFHLSTKRLIRELPPLLSCLRKIYKKYIHGRERVSSTITHLHTHTKEEEEKFWVREVSSFDILSCLCFHLLVFSCHT